MTLMSIQKMNNTMAVDKAYNIADCDHVCIICNYHTKEHNASDQTVHKYCMNEYAKFSKKLENTKMCSMCGSTTRKLILDSNCCNSCLNSAF